MSLPPPFVQDIVDTTKKVARGWVSWYQKAGSVLPTGGAVVTLSPTASPWTYQYTGLSPATFLISATNTVSGTTKRTVGSSTYTNTFFSQTTGTNIYSIVVSYLDTITITYTGTVNSAYLIPL